MSASLMLVLPTPEMRNRKLDRLLRRLRELQDARDELLAALLKIEAARQAALREMGED